MVVSGMNVSLVGALVLATTSACIEGSPEGAKVGDELGADVGLDVGEKVNKSRGALHIPSQLNDLQLPMISVSQDMAYRKAVLEGQTRHWQLSFWIGTFGPSVTASLPRAGL